MRRARLLRLLPLAALVAAGAERFRPLPRLQVSENRRFLVTAEGKPFFYLGDTAWELAHRLDRKEATAYLAVRAKQGFNVIQCVALAELDGLTDPNAYGKLPLIDRDPTRPAVTKGADPADAAQYDYWDHLEYIIDEANRLGLYIGLLPTWARWMPNPRANGEQIFTAANAEVYGRFLGWRFGRKGIIWILGGDRPATGAEDVWRALARGIAIGVNGKEDYGGLTMSFHPTGGNTSSTWFHNDPWLTFNMHQTGHVPADRDECWLKIAADYNREPVKPVMDGEPLYEDHPIGFRQAKQYGYSMDAHVRQRAYWDVFSGAFGHTYGDHAVWQMYSPKRRAVNGPLFYWYEAIHRPGAQQMRFVRELMESRPFLSRVPDQSLVAEALGGADHIAVTRGDGYAFVYSAQGRSFQVRMGKIAGERVKAWWYNPRNGAVTAIDTFENSGTREFVCPSLGGLGSDWVLVLDDAGRKFPPPGCGHACA
jgi:hypothetical protein